jgi:CheY-like chemotaxis protein
MPSPLILVFWDDTDIIQALSHFFERDGDAVLSARSYDEALLACQRRPPDILILLRFMQQHQGIEDGIEFRRHLPEWPNLPRFPIIVGYVEGASARQKVFDAGANGCFGRVFDPNDVLEEVKILLAAPTTTHLVDRQTAMFGGKELNRMCIDPSTGEQGFRVLSRGSGHICRGT